MGEASRLNVNMMIDLDKEKKYEFNLKKNDKKIGWCMLEKTGCGIYKISYEIYEGFRNCGYGVEGVRMIIDKVFEERKDLKIVAVIDEKNIAAWRVLEKVGFLEESIFFDKENNAMMRKYALKN